MAELTLRIQSYHTDRPSWRSMARAALDALLAQPSVDDGRLAAIGYCFGGSTALELARTGAPLAADQRSWAAMRHPFDEVFN
jgi:dienelactone hydrolase